MAHVLHAYQIEGDGRGTPLEGEAISKVIKSDQLAWVHMDVRDIATREWLNTELSYLDHIIVDALLAEETRPRIVEVGDGVLLILRGVNLNADSEPEDMVSIRLWIDDHRIISLQRRPLKAVADLQAKLEEGRGPKNSGEFLAALSNALFERMEPVFSELDDALDDIEEKILEQSQGVDRKIINRIRRQAIVFRRYVAPQKDAIAVLKTCDMSWIDNAQRRKLQEGHDRLIRYVEDLDAIRERAQIIKEEVASVMADTMNKNMYVLSVIAAIFLPLGFFTGLLGINIGGIPGVDNPYAFTIFCVVLTVVVIGQILYFKWKKWF